MIICSDYLSRSESNSKAILAEECFALKQFRSWWSTVIILDGKLILMVRFTMFRRLKQKPVFQEEWVEVSKVSPPTSKLVNKANQDWLREQKYNIWIQWQRKKDVNNYLVIGFSLAEGRKLWAGFFCIVLLENCPCSENQWMAGQFGFCVMSPDEYLHALYGNSQLVFPTPKGF